MIKLTVKGVRIISSFIICALITLVAVFCFLPEKSVYLWGSDGYEPYYSGDTTSDKVSLMFNVYEGSDIVSSILDTLQINDAKATFFVGGCWADDNADLLLRIVKEGHEIGNHGYFHLDHKKLDYNGNYNEISNNHKIVKGLCGVEMKLFAPPSGAFSEATLEAARSLNYKTILWTKDTIDWRDKSEGLVFKRATDNIASGDLILMHPKQHTLNSLNKILEFYKEKGLRAVTVSECININVI